MRMKKGDGLFRKSLTEIFHVSKGIFFCIYLLSAIRGALLSLPVICLQRFFDKVALISAENSLWAECLWLAAGLFVIKMLLQIVSSIEDYLYEYHELASMQKLMYKTNEKVQILNGVSFERKETLEAIEKAYTGTGQVRKLPDTILTVLLSYLPGCCILGAYLYKANPVLLLIFVCIFFPVVISHTIKERMYSGLEDQTAPLQRKINAYSEYMAGREYYKETRLIGAYKYFYEHLKALFEDYKVISRKTQLKADIWEFIMKLITITGYLLILIILYFSVRSGTVTVGYFAAIFAYLDRLFSMTEEVVYGIIGNTVEVFEKIRNYFRMQERGEAAYGDSELSGDLSITLQEVSFAYPNMKEDVLKEINLAIYPGEKIAIVGENGSGKSTLIKLMIGLYEPTAGMVRYNNRGKNEYQKGGVQRQMSAVFQNFARYQMKLDENIKLGDWEKEGAAEETLKKLSMTLKKEAFPQGMKTMLSKEFGGTELSTGQWQRIAIARGCYRDCKIIILDEPTSAIDPAEESAIYDQFEKIAEETDTAVFVTHRMGAVRFADRILVMQEGRLAADGSHEELLKNCTEYRKLWNAQAEQYAN